MERFQFWLSIQFLWHGEYFIQPCFEFLLSMIVEIDTEAFSVFFSHMSAYKVYRMIHLTDENCRVTTEGTLTRRFWRVNTRVVVKVTLAARILTLSVTVERREEVRYKETNYNQKNCIFWIWSWEWQQVDNNKLSKSDKKSRPSNQCGSKEVRNKHDEQRTGGKKRYESDATKP